MTNISRTSWELCRTSCWCCRSTRTGTAGFRSLQALPIILGGRVLGRIILGLRYYVSPQLFPMIIVGTLGTIFVLDVGIVCCCLDICIIIMKEPGLLPYDGLQHLECFTLTDAPTPLNRWRRGGGSSASSTLLNRKRIFVSGESYAVSCNTQALHQGSSSLYFEFVLTIWYIENGNL